MRALILVAAASLAVSACDDRAEGNLEPTNNTVAIEEPDAVGGGVGSEGETRPHSAARSSEFTTETGDATIEAQNVTVVDKDRTTTSK